MFMKNVLRVLLKTILIVSLFAGTLSLRAQGTSFTYQGRLNAGGSPADGLYDFRFKLYFDAEGDNQAGSTLLTNGLPVTNGLFTATLDFGEGLFAGSNFWLEVDVRTNGAANYTALTPLQALTPAPYAIFANTASNLLGTLAASQLSGAIPLAQLPAGVVTNNETNVTLAGALSGNGGGLTNVNAATVQGSSAANFWQLTGNTGTTPDVNYIGTTDNQPLELRANSGRVLLLEPGGASATQGTTALTGAPNVIGGSPVNFVSSGVVGAVIGGGGATNYFGSDSSNSIGAYSDFSTIGGGLDNTIQTYSPGSTIGGASENTIQTDSYGSTISGGEVNTIQYYSYLSTIDGGYGNTIQTNSYESTIGGGYANTIQTNAPDSTIGGGEGNDIGFDAGSSTIGGGYDNTIQANSYQSTIGGGYDNIIQINSSASTIGGGAFNTIQTNSYESTIDGGYDNTIQTNSVDSTIGGGYDNTIQTNSFQSTIDGGNNNTIQGGAYDSTIGGGGYNTIEANSIESTIAGGNNNTIGTFSGDSTIGGGAYNTIEANSIESTIGGGINNTASGAYAVVPGGVNNQAKGVCSIACGNGAIAQEANTFVWADGQANSFPSGGIANTFNVRATGGVWLWSAANTSGGGTAGVELKPGETSWSVLSDRNAKKNFQPVNTKALLEKLAAIPIQQWNYKWEKDSEVPNIGPMAQDFKAAFYPGRDDKSINTLEFDGVELAAIQGLNQKLKEKDAEIATLQEKAAKVDSLEKRLTQLEQVVQSLAERK
jgi:hypothetical protein